MNFHPAQQSDISTFTKPGIRNTWQHRRKTKTGISYVRREMDLMNVFRAWKIDWMPCQLRRALFEFPDTLTQSIPYRKSKTRVVGIADIPSKNCIFTWWGGPLPTDMNILDLTILSTEFFELYKNQNSHDDDSIIYGISVIMFSHS